MKFIAPLKQCKNDVNNNNNDKNNNNNNNNNNNIVKVVEVFNVAKVDVKTFVTVFVDINCCAFAPPGGSLTQS